MSITVNLRYTGTDGSARKFAEEMISSGTVELIRNEPGNLRYEYYLSVDDPETVLLIDSWADQKAIDVHHDSKMMDTILELRKKYDLRVSAERYISEDAINEILMSRIGSYSESDPTSKAKADELKALQKELAKTDDDVILRRGKE
jgi:quinol monooxygenase YgiN